MCTTAELVDVICTLCCRGTTVLTCCSLCIGEISFCQTEQEEVGIGELCILGGTIVTAEVGPLGNSIAVGKLCGFLDIECTAFTAEQGTVITGSRCHGIRLYILRGIAQREELLHEFWTGAVTTPCLCGVVGSHTVVGISVHVSVEGRCDAEECTTPTGCRRTILENREHCLVSSTALTIVGHEQHLVGAPLIGTSGVQTVTGIDDLFGIFSGLGPLGCASVDLCVQIETGQQHPGSTFRGTAIAVVSRLHGFGIHQLGLKLKKFFLNPVISIHTRDLLRLAKSCSKWNVSECIHKHVILQGANETHLCHFLGITTFANFIDVAVAVVDTCGETIVEHMHHRVSSVILVEVEAGNTGVAPTADGLVGGQFIRIPQLTDKTSSTTIVTINIRVTVGTTVAGQCKVGIALQVQTIQANLCREVGVYRIHIQITRTRGHAECQCKCGCRNDILNDIFHNLILLFIL